MSNPRNEPSQRSTGVFAIVLILLLAAALRLPGLHWGLPDALHPGYSWHPDELGTLFNARAMAAGELWPIHFIYGGTLYYSLLNAFYHYGRLLGDMLGGVNDVANAILFGRCFLAACSLLTVLLTWRIGERLFNPATGRLAALFLALSPAHAFLAQNMRPDEFATLVALLLVWLGALILQGQPARDWGHFGAAGLLAGFAVALRFPLGIFSVAPVLAYLLRERRAGWKADLAGLLYWRLPLLLVGAALAYALASPYSLLRPDLLREGLEVQKDYQTAPFADAVGRGPGIYQYGWLMLQQALGIPLHLLALAGVLLAALRWSAPRLLLLAPALAYLIPTTLVSWVVVRYTLPILPLLSLLAADAMVSSAERGPARRRIAATVAACIVAWTLLGDAAFLRIQTGRNARELATSWIEAHIPKDASIVEIEQYAQDVYLNPRIPAGYRHFKFTLDAGTEGLLLDESPDHDYIVMNSAIYLNMDRLGVRNPLNGAHKLQEILESGHYQLATEITLPVRLLGVDYSRQFTSQDFSIINPGERIYRYADTPTPKASAAS